MAFEDEMEMDFFRFFDGIFVWWALRDPPLLEPPRNGEGPFLSERCWVMDFISLDILMNFNVPKKKDLKISVWRWLDEGWFQDWKLKWLWCLPSGKLT